jgi:hypothetical protein
MKGNIDPDSKPAWSTIFTIAAVTGLSSVVKAMGEFFQFVV